MLGWMWCSELLVVDTFGLRNGAGDPLRDASARGGAVAAARLAGLVVKDLRAAHGFYARTLGLRCRRIRSSWFLLDVRCRLHPARTTNGAATAATATALRGERRCVTLQLPDLQAALRALLARHVRVHRFDGDGSEREVVALDPSGAARVDAVFVDDPDGNELQLLQAGSSAWTALP
jgi:catechol 2,3-dioxygenase-like lactoylglutathione lyase family enzyme